ncbi:hypothetical protein J3F83DRAFT_755651 [Trichoderma novae-zelandiae]
MHVEANTQLIGIILLVIAPTRIACWHSAYMTCILSILPHSPSFPLIPPQSSNRAGLSVAGYIPTGSFVALAVSHLSSPCSSYFIPSWNPRVHTCDCFMLRLLHL